MRGKPLGTKETRRHVAAPFPPPPHVEDLSSSLHYKVKNQLKPSLLPLFMAQSAAQAAAAAAAAAHPANAAAAAVQPADDDRADRAAGPHKCAAEGCRSRLTIATDGRKCTACIEHCNEEKCDHRAHVLSRRARALPAPSAPAGQVAGASPMDWKALATIFGDAMGGKMSEALKALAPSPERSSAGSSRDKDRDRELPTADEFHLGGQRKLFAAHPANLTESQWAEKLLTLRTKSQAHVELVELMRHEKEKAAPTEPPSLLDSQASIEKVIKDDGDDGQVDPPAIRELAGVMAVLRQLTVQGVDLKIPRSFLQDGATGEIEADVALNAPVVARLEEKGRAAFHTIIERQLALHANDPVQYITGKTAGRRSQPWCARAVLVWMAGYQRHRAKRLASWRPPPTLELLCTPTTLPIINHESPIDLLPFFVQLGLLILMQESRNYGPLGDSLSAVEASIIGALAKFQTKFILSPDNVAAAKGALTASPATGGGAGGKRQRVEDTDLSGQPPGKRQRGGLAKKLADKKKEMDAAAAAGGSPAPGPKAEPIDWAARVPAELKPHYKPPPGHDQLYRKCCNPHCKQKSPPAWVVKEGVRRPFCKVCMPA